MLQDRFGFICRSFICHQNFRRQHSESWMICLLLELWDVAVEEGIFLTF